MINRHEDLACYGSEYKWVSMNLLRRGYSLFNKAPIVKNFDEIEYIISKNGNVNISDTHQISLLTDSTLDVFCMVSTFEFIAKAILLLERICIHKIDSNLSNTLAKQQHKEPIAIVDMLEEENKNFGPDDSKINILLYKTISLSDVIENKNYYLRINFNKDLILILSRLVKTRNMNTHFFSLWEQTGLYIFDSYLFLKEILNNRIKDLHNKLVIDLYSSKSDLIIR